MARVKLAIARNTVTVILASCRKPSGCDARCPLQRVVPPALRHPVALISRPRNPKNSSRRPHPVPNVRPSWTLGVVLTVRSHVVETMLLMEWRTAGSAWALFSEAEITARRRAHDGLRVASLSRVKCFAALCSQSDILLSFQPLRHVDGPNKRACHDRFAMQSCHKHCWQRYHMAIDFASGTRDGQISVYVRQLSSYPIAITASVGRPPQAVPGI